jgi:hypothetical protein
VEQLSERLEPGFRIRTIGVTVVFHFHRMWNSTDPSRAALVVADRVLPVGGVQR